MEVIKLSPVDRKAAAGVFARAFFDYPMMTYIWPDPLRRKRFFKWYSECAVGYALRYGDAYTTPDIAGICMWLPPTQPYLSIIRSFRAGFFPLPYAIGFKNYVQRNLQNDIATMRAHKQSIPGPHWYLWAIVVEPRRQGRGIGSSLLNAGLGRADSDQLPCYLETHDERNIAFYQNHGFKMIRTELVPGSSLRFWCFKRSPQNSS